MNYFDKYVVTYLNNIFVYNDNIKKHKKHVDKIFQKFRKIDIQTNINKCKFHKIKTKFLNVLVKRNEIYINSTQIIAIVTWKTLTNLIQIQSFFKFVNFYRRFINFFFENNENADTHNEKKFEFEWIFACKSIFQNFKKRMTEILILVHLNSELKTISKLNLNDYVSIEIFSKKIISFDLLVFFSRHYCRQNAITKFMTKIC